MTVWGRVDLRCGGNPWRARQRAWGEAVYDVGATHGGRGNARGGRRIYDVGATVRLSSSYVAREGNPCSKAGNPRRRGWPGVLVGGRGRGFRVAGGYMTIILSWVSPTSERGSTGGSFGRSPWRSISSTLNTCITG